MYFYFFFKEPKKKKNDQQVPLIVERPQPHQNVPRPATAEWSNEGELLLPNNMTDRVSAKGGRVTNQLHDEGKQRCKPPRPSHDRIDEVTSSDESLQLFSRGMQKSATVHHFQSSPITPLHNVRLNISVPDVVQSCSKDDTLTNVIFPVSLFVRK